MANAARGEVPLADTGLVLRYPANSICELEDALGGKSFIQVFNAMGVAPPMKVMRALLWAGLLDCKPELTMKEAGALLDTVGLKEAMQAVGAAVKLAYPKADDGAPPEKH